MTEAHQHPGDTLLLQELLVARRRVAAQVDVISHFVGLGAANWLLSLSFAEDETRHLLELAVFFLGVLVVSGLHK